MCDFKAKNINKLNTHISTYESYECDECYFRVKTLSIIRTQMEEVHETENVKNKQFKVR